MAEPIAKTKRLPTLLPLKMTKLHKGVAPKGLVTYFKTSNLHYIKYITFPTTAYFSNITTVYIKRDYLQIPKIHNLLRFP